MSLVAGVRGFTEGGFNWDLSASVGAHETDLFIENTVNASLGYDTPTAFDLGSNRQQEVGISFDVSYAVNDVVNVAAGADWIRITRGTAVPRLPQPRSRRRP